MSAVDTEPVVAVRFTVRGRVQGVGFRPFVARLARRFGLCGWVRNDGDAVRIYVEGPADRVAAFETTLASEDASPAARVEAFARERVGVTHATAFEVVPGESAEVGAVRVPPDRATCPACRAEVFDPADRRFRHPFANCTDCGPRYTIVRAMPYDRHRTAMAGFAPCIDCRREYTDPTDRRFHAQPIACPHCGPRVALTTPDGVAIASGDAAVRRAAAELIAGRIIALKGLGGFQLLVRADDPAAVRRLRNHKHRPTKPFAVMARTIEEAERLAVIGPAERVALAAAENPIVLLRRRAGAPIAAEVAPQLDTIGVMLPTTPLHHLLLAELLFPVVATSGNRAGEPIATTDAEAGRMLGGIADAVLTHDRPVLRRADDSVVRVIAGRPSAVRVARGFAPLPLPDLEAWAWRRDLPAGVLAVGGQQKNAVALWTGTQAVLGPHVGDLDGPAVEDAFAAMTRDLPDLYRCPVTAVACDRHPDYATTRWAAESGLPLVRVQHHHAHAAAVIAEHGLFDREVLAFTWDGTGFGDDGTVWGGEALRATLHGFTRVASLRPFPLPGGDAAVRHPARVALVLAAESVGADAVLRDGRLLDRLGFDRVTAETLLRMAARGVNSPSTTSMGRLFDGVAALAGLTAPASYEGEAAVRLEAACADGPHDPYPLEGGDWRPLIRAVLADVASDVPAGVVATRFHLALARWAAAVAGATPGLPVVLGGGCFQNRRLTESVRAGLERAGRAVFQPEAVPANDGGLAVGQLAVALAALEGG